MKKTWFYFIILFTVFACQKEDASIIGWEKVSITSINNISPSLLALSGSNMYAVSDDFKNLLYKSADGGINWIEVTGIPKRVNSITIWNQYILAGTSAGIYRSTDNGVTWLAANTGLKYFTEVNTFVCSNKVYAYTSGDVFTTDNNGESWSSVSTGLDSTPIRAFTIKGTSYIAATWEGIYRSDDNGIKWTNAVADNNYVKTLAISGTNVIAGATDGLYYSADDASNWIKAKITDEDYQSPSIRCFAVLGKNIYAGSESHGIYFSSDNGINWSKFNTGFTDTLTCYSLFVSGGNLYARTSRGLWKRQL